MGALADKIQSLRPAISEPLEASGSPGLSLGVLHLGKIIPAAHFGRQDLDEPHSPNDNTIYHLASLTNVLAGAVAYLVN